jgi:hypothetical protein
MSLLMERFGLTRDRAIELQNHYRDLTRAEPKGDRQAAFRTALERARKGEFEDGRKVDALARARFVIVFDLDDTLYNQYYDPEVGKTCRDFEVRDATGTRSVKVAPGVAVAFDRIHALGGAVVIFTANLDDTTLANLRAWQIGGQPVAGHPLVAGVLSHSHLVLQDKREGRGAENPRKGRPVIEPSKDLRVVDESLKRAILVDDNPLRAFQFRNFRAVHKFDAALYCTTKDAKVKAAFDKIIAEVVDEIEETVRHSQSKGVDFATAYLPYSLMGRIAVDALRAGGMSERAAIAHVRAHPELVPEDF